MSGRLSPPVIDVQRVTLTENLRAPSRARAWVAEQIADVPESVLDDALLVTSELVTNAIRYGLPDITLTVTHRPSGVRIEVSDQGEALPLMTRQAPHRDAASGRGLLIVASTASSWGISPHNPPPGKTVWVELSAT